MIYYEYNEKYLCSLNDEYDYNKINEEEALDNCSELYFLLKLNKEKSKKSFAVNSTSDFYIKEESLDLLKINDAPTVSPILQKLIDKRKIKAINTDYEDYKELFFMEEKRKKTVNILALGDVGSTLLMGLKILGGDFIERIGVYDRSIDKINRFEIEMNQIQFPFRYDAMPEVSGIKKGELFDCDMFVFCASKGIPPVGSDAKDVRMIQYEENAKLIKEYALMAAEKNFKGIFAVVSDPVDLLCKTVLVESNGKLSPEQIKGYGLGVMNGRAVYYAKKYDKYNQYLTGGRAFGPHGNDLVIADNINNYDDKLSKELTNLVVNANLEVRKIGFKPYIAPALSSGAISIIYTFKGEWHYSSNYIGGVYMGANNRNLSAGLEIEKINMPVELFERLQATYGKLKQFNLLF